LPAALAIIAEELCYRRVRAERRILKRERERKRMKR